MSTNMGSEDRFGYQWATYSVIRPEYEEQFRRWTAHLSEEDWLGKSFLDVGCGMGRNGYWPMTYGASRGVAIDVDERSLEAARRTLADFPAVEVRFMSAYDIDFCDAFDIVFAIGVIQHLQWPERALKAMVKAAKPGGKVLIWVYGLENNEWVVRFLNPLRKSLFSRLPVGIVRFISLFPAAAVWLALRMGIGTTEYFNLLRRFRFSHLRLIVLDQMLPKIANYWSKQEVENMMRQTGLTAVELEWVNQISWSAIGTKPVSQE